LHQVGDLFELNVKLRCKKVKSSSSHYTADTFNEVTLQLQQIDKWCTLHSSTQT